MARSIRRGEIPYAPTGTGEYVEEIFSLKGFFGEWAHLYRRRNLAHPVRWSDERLMYSGLDSGALRATDAEDPRGEPLRLMEGEGHAISLSQRSAPMPFAEKDVDFHQIRFYHRGRFRLETELGPLEIEEGDFVVVPRGMIYRETPLTTEGNAVFAFETTATVQPAKEMWDGVGYASLFIDFSAAEVPEPRGGEEIGGETEVRVRCDGELLTMTYSHDPCRDVVGWLGDPVLFKMSVWSVPGPGTSRGHLTPPASCVLLGENKEFFFNALAMQPFPNTPAPHGSIGPPSHLNDYDEVWLTHRSQIAPEDHLWLLPRTLPHPGFKMPTSYPPNPVREMREMRINFDTEKPLRWTEAAREALFDDPLVTQYTSFMGFPPEAVPGYLRERDEPGPG